MLKGSGAVVVDSLTVVARSYEACLMLMSVSVSCHAWKTDGRLLKGTYSSRKNDQLVACCIIDLLSYRECQARSTCKCKEDVRGAL
jgi:hypothetical protein